MGRAARPYRLTLGQKYSTQPTPSMIGSNHQSLVKIRYFRISLYFCPVCRSSVNISKFFSALFELWKWWQVYNMRQSFAWRHCLLQFQPSRSTSKRRKAIIFSGLCSIGGDLYINTIFKHLKDDKSCINKCSCWTIKRQRFFTYWSRQAKSIGMVHVLNSNR